VIPQYVRNIHEYHYSQRQIVLRFDGSQNVCYVIKTHFDTQYVRNIKIILVLTTAIDL